jgi:hypothetical protein
VAAFEVIVHGVDISTLHTLQDRPLIIYFVVRQKIASTVVEATLSLFGEDK